MPLIKKYEFWNPRVFEFPYYLYLGGQCLLKRLSIRDLARANYALDHGEIGLGSKLATQLCFDQQYFLPSDLVLDQWSPQEKKRFIFQFAERYQYPVILKPNIGCVGKGLRKGITPVAKTSFHVAILWRAIHIWSYTPILLRRARAIDRAIP